MPYNIINLKNSNKDGNFKVVLKDTGEVLSKHTQKPYQQIYAIEANKNFKKIGKYKYYVSEKKGKKLKVLVNNKWIHFGAYPYEHYQDRTGLLNDKYNHLDPIRRKQYIARASKIRNKEGLLTANDPNSANYHAIRILW